MLNALGLGVVILLACDRGTVQSEVLDRHREPWASLDRPNVVNPLRVAVLVAAAVLVAGCASSGGQSGGTVPSVSQRTTTPVVPSNRTIATDVPDTVDIPPVPSKKVSEVSSSPASTLAVAADPLKNLPFDLVVTPSAASSGDTVTVTYSGDLSGDWMTGINAYLDQYTGDGWRTAWGMLNDSFSKVATSIVAGAPPTSQLPVAVSLVTPTRFVLPKRIAPGGYRFCQDVSRAASSKGRYESGRVCSVLTII